MHLPDPDFLSPEVRALVYLCTLPGPGAFLIYMSDSQIGFSMKLKARAFEHWGTRPGREKEKKNVSFFGYCT